MALGHVLAFVEHTWETIITEQCWTYPLASWLFPSLLIPLDDMPVQQKPEPSHHIHGSKAR